jgi:hypothetical protein
MKLSTFLKKLGSYIIYYPAIANMLGGVKEAIFLLNLISWYSGKEIYKDRLQIKNETGLTFREQAAARKRLKDLGILTERYCRAEHRLYYTPILSKLDDLYEKYAITCSRQVTKCQVAGDKMSSGSVQNVTSYIYRTDSYTDSHTDSRARTGDFLTNRFDEAFLIYPNRFGDNSKSAAFENYVKLISGGETHDKILTCIENYKIYCQDSQIVNTQFVMTMAKFLGKGKHYLSYAHQMKRAHWAEGMIIENSEETICINKTKSSKK